MSSSVFAVGGPASSPQNEEAGADKPNLKAMCQHTWRNDHGQLVYKHPRDDRVLPAVFHHEIRGELLSLASNNNTLVYDTPRAPGAKERTQYLHNETAYLEEHNGIRLDDRATWPRTLLKYKPDDNDFAISHKSIWTVNGRVVLDAQAFPMFRRPHVPMVICSKFEPLYIELCLRMEPDMTWDELLARMPLGAQAKERRNLRMRVLRNNDHEGLLCWNGNRESWMKRAFFDFRMKPIGLQNNSVENVERLTDKEYQELDIISTGTSSAKSPKNIAAVESKEAFEVSAKVKKIDFFVKKYVSWPKLFDTHVELLNKHNSGYLPSVGYGPGMIIPTTNKDEQFGQNRKTNQYDRILTEALLGPNPQFQNVNLLTPRVPAFSPGYRTAAPLPHPLPVQAITAASAAPAAPRFEQPTMQDYNASNGPNPYLQHPPLRNNYGLAPSDPLYSIGSGLQAGQAPGYITHSLTHPYAHDDALDLMNLGAPHVFAHAMNQTMGTKRSFVHQGVDDQSSNKRSRSAAYVPQVLSAELLPAPAPHSVQSYERKRAMDGEADTSELPQPAKRMRKSKPTTQAVPNASDEKKIRAQRTTYAKEPLETNDSSIASNSVTAPGTHHRQAPAPYLACITQSSRPYEFDTYMQQSGNDPFLSNTGYEQHSVSMPNHAQPAYHHDLTIVPQSSFESAQAPLDPTLSIGTLGARAESFPMSNSGHASYEVTQSSYDQGSNFALRNEYQEWLQEPQIQGEASTSVTEAPIS